MSSGKWRPCCLGLNVLNQWAGEKDKPECLNYEMEQYPVSLIYMWCYGTIRIQQENTWI